MQPEPVGLRGRLEEKNDAVAQTLAETSADRLRTLDQVCEGERLCAGQTLELLYALSTVRSAHPAMCDRVGCDVDERRLLPGVAAAHHRAAEGKHANACQLSLCAGVCWVGLQPHQRPRLGLRERRPASVIDALQTVLADDAQVALAPLKRQRAQGKGRAHVRP